MFKMWIVYFHLYKTETIIGWQILCTNTYDPFDDDYVLRVKLWA